MMNLAWLTSAFGRVTFLKKYLSATEDSWGRHAGMWVGGPDTFGDFEARRFRQALFWALYQNTAYDGETHPWAPSRSAGSGLYRYTRGTNNPAYRLAEVFATHIFNGQVDPEAGDGRIVPSAIPIKTKNEAIRPPIAKLWRDSCWGVNKAIYCRSGTVTGDTALALVDNVAKGRIEMEVVDPAALRWVGRDLQGNVTGYIRQEYRPNPDYHPARRFGEARAVDATAPINYQRYVLYTEVCWREGDRVSYETYRADERYNWRGLDAAGSPLPWTWEADYGFIPMVVHPHIKVRPGQEWGFGEFNAILAKVDEVNDLGSKLHDQIRKVVEGMWFMAGVRPPAPAPEVSEKESTAADPQPGRQEMKVIYAPSVGATVTPLVVPLDIQFASLEIINQAEELQKDSPVLKFDSLRVSGDASAKALREARKKAEGVVQERRAGYDDSLVRAHKMALSMGRMRDYKVYRDLPADAYRDGKLDHSIGWRTVFGVDPLDQAELDLARGNAVIAWKSAGVPPRLALQHAGWTEDQLTQYDDAVADEQEKALANQKALLALAPPKPAESPAKPAGNGRPAPVPTPN